MTTYATTHLILTNRQLNHGEPDSTYKVSAYLLADGRLYVPGAGVDGGDSLFAALDDYAPNGCDEFVGHEIGELGDLGEVDLADLALADRDNVKWNGKTLLTADEAEKAVDLLSEIDEDAARKLAEVSDPHRAERAQAAAQVAASLRLVAECDGVMVTAQWDAEESRYSLELVRDGAVIGCGGWWVPGGRIEDLAVALSQDPDDSDDLYAGLENVLEEVFRQELART